MIRQPEPRSGREQVYAILRIDAYLGSPSEFPVDRLVTVKAVVRNLEYAKAEVERLNALRPNRECFYLWQTTRLLQDAPLSFDPGESRTMESRTTPIESFEQTPIES